ncbi:MAG: carbohydrate-binding protein [Firmicutes bacterium]|nr:carbohydrate-binding protein [Bacillota bacterium]
MPATASSTAEGYETASGDGVSVSPVPITKGQRVTVIYEGVLARQGAKAVVLHYGIGPGDWRHVRDVPMVETAPGRFEASLEVPMDGRLEFCFRDGAYNWDNNSGRNWSYIIHSGGGSLA